MLALILLVIVIILVVSIIKYTDKHEIDMELAKHGKTRESARAETSSTRRRNSRKSGKEKPGKMVAQSGTIRDITHPKANEYKVYGSGNQMLCTVRAKGKLVGWGDEFFLMDDDGKITTYNYEGDRLGTVKYNPSKEYIGSIRKSGFTIVSDRNSNRRKVFDEQCRRD